MWRLADEEIAGLVNEIRRARAYIEKVEAVTEPVIAKAKQRLELLLTYRGENWSDNAGYAQLVARGKRVTYDTETLDALILSDPVQYGWLQKYRKEMVVESGIRVK